MRRGLRWRAFLFLFSFLSSFAFLIISLFLRNIFRFVDVDESEGSKKVAPSSMLSDMYFTLFIPSFFSLPFHHHLHFFCFVLFSSSFLFCVIFFTSSLAFLPLTFFSTLRYSCAFIYFALQRHTPFYNFL